MSANDKIDWTVRSSALERGDRFISDHRYVTLSSNYFIHVIDRVRLAMPRAFLQV